MRSLVAVPLLLSAACASLRYDLAGVPFPVQATPAPAGATAEPFVATGKAVVWLHGLFGDSQPDVAALLQETAGPCAGVASFRATASASFHDWLLTHLTLGLVRIKTVTITGERLRT
ncbi:MAG: hypothetical protein KF830_12260 [Planctomycetes bacterium]|nr:hypothetical protein [Planctomycetota bacterium]